MSASSSYPPGPGGDYDERLLNNAPKATKAELQEGYNVNLLASDSSDSPMNARTQATIDEHGPHEAGTPPNKETYPSSYSVPWYRQGKWRVLMLVVAVVIIGAVVGGVVGHVVSVNNRNNKSNAPKIPTSNPSSSMSFDTSLVAPAQPTDGPQLSTFSSSSSTPPPQLTTTGAAALPTGTGTGRLGIDTGPSPVAVVG